MNRLKVSIDIQSTRYKIWKALWDEKSYRTWAEVFYKGSYMIAKGWEVGHKVYFLSPDHSGIYSIIELHVPGEIIRYKHLGKVIQGKEQPIDEDTKSWTGAKESYILTKNGVNITLTIDLNVQDEHLEYMSKTLPKGLEKIKGMAEGL